MPTEQTAPEVVVEAALRREEINPESLGTWGGLALVPGRPHLSIGFRAIEQSPAALAIVALQVCIVGMLVMDGASVSGPAPSSTILIAPTLRLFGASGHHVSGVLANLSHRPAVMLETILAVLPWLMALNMGWYCLARTMGDAGKGRVSIARFLTCGVMGLFPLRLVASLAIPKWFPYKGDWKSTMSIHARLLQFSIAYGLACNKTRKDIEMQFAQAIDHHAREIIDGYGSYILLPPLAMIALLIGATWLFPIFIPEPVLDLLWSPAAFGFIGAWVAFERSCLGAMTFLFLSGATQEESSPYETEKHPP